MLFTIIKVKKLKQNNIIRDNENKRCIKYTMKADERLNIY